MITIWFDAIDGKGKLLGSVELEFIPYPGTTIMMTYGDGEHAYPVVVDSVVNNTLHVHRPKRENASECARRIIRELNQHRERIRP